VHVDKLSPAKPITSLNAMMGIAFAPSYGLQLEHLRLIATIPKHQPVARRMG